MIVNPVINHPEQQLGDTFFDFSRRIAVMAIVNRTPDSFYDKGKTFELDLAIAAGAQAFEDGADIVDVGGVKFAPGPPLAVAEEIKRVIPFVREVAKIGPVSVDTFHPEVAEAAIHAGAAIINDTTGVHDPKMADVVAYSDARLVVAHSVAKPRTKIIAPQYADITHDVKEFLKDRVALSLSRGVRPEQLIVDPGHDLNKNTLHTLEMTRNLASFADMGFPLLVALSNKDFIGESLGRDRHERLAGSLSAAVFCATQGARIVRVHNVAETFDALRMFESIMGWREPVFLKHNMPQDKIRGV